MNSKLKKTIASLMCLSLVLPMGIPSVYSEDAPAEEAAVEEEEKSSKKDEDETPRTEEEAMALMEKAASNSKLELYMNKKEGTVALKDLKTGMVWFSNPVDLETSNAKKSQKQELASGMTLIYGEPYNRSTTTQTSKAKGKFQMEKINNGVRVTFKYDGPGITIPVDLTLEDDHLKLYVNTSDIVEEHPSTVDGQIITDLAFMTTFGAAGLEDEGYFVVPDGSGAVINFNNGKTNLKTYTGKVYGRDITAVKTQKQASIQNVSFPMFGIVKNGNGLMVVADKGDTCASINTYVSNQNNTDYNSAYFDFELRTSDEYLMGGESNPLKVFEKRGILVPEIEVRYYPVETSKDEVDYIDIAETYRKYLINEKGVVDKELKDSSSLYLDIYGGTLKTESVAGLPVTVKEPVTTFATGKYILETLNGLGVDDMVVSYNNYSNEDIGEKVTDSFSPASKLGGAKKFNELKKYAESNNIKLFPQVDNQQFKTGNGYWNMTNTAIRVSNAYSQIVVFDLAHGVENKYYKPLSLFTPASYEKAFNKLISSCTKKKSTNFAFGTLANTIYGDYGKKAVSREGAKSIVEGIYAKAKSSGTVLADDASAYVLPYADYIANVPVCSSKFDLFDYDIPFYQMVMHGITPTAGTAVNGEGNMADAVLYNIAAGNNIGFDFVGIEASDLKDTKLDKYFYAYYANWMDEASGLYKLADAVLAPVSDDTITAYNISEDGNVIETVYSSGYTTVVDLSAYTVKAGGNTYQLADYVGKEVIGL